MFWVEWYKSVILVAITQVTFGEEEKPFVNCVGGRCQAS